LLKSTDAVEVVPTDPPVTWRIRITRPGGGNLTEDLVTKNMEVEDVILVLGYEWDWGLLPKLTVGTPVREDASVMV
jgi:hypothetical protein